MPPDAVMTVADHERREELRREEDRRMWKKLDEIAIMLATVEERQSRTHSDLQELKADMKALQAHGCFRMPEHEDLKRRVELLESRISEPSDAPGFGRYATTVTGGTVSFLAILATVWKAMGWM